MASVRKRLRSDVDFESLERRVLRELDDLVWRARDDISARLREASQEIDELTRENERLAEEVEMLRDKVADLRCEIEESVR